jgi:hypothetical protein
MCPSSPCSYYPGVFFYGPIYFNFTQLVPTFLCVSVSFTSVYYFVVISLPLQFIQFCFPAGCCTVCVSIALASYMSFKYSHVVMSPMGHTVIMVSKSGNIVFAIKVFWQYCICDKGVLPSVCGRYCCSRS